MTRDRTRSIPAGRAGRVPPRDLRRRREELLAREIGAVRKEWGGRVRVALVYPNLYRAGMSNLGFLIVHGRINARADALCERAFLADPAEARLLGRRGLPLATLESGRRLADFDVVAFSLSYENDLLNLPGILAGGGLVPFRAAREGAGGPRPLLLAGGFAASLNPEPAGTIADAVVVGDGERAIDAVLDLGAPRPGDEGYLRELAAIPGVYVPGGYVPEYERPPGSGRLLAQRPRPGFPARVGREALSPADCPPAVPVLAEDAELGRMALVETSRGCPKMCAFCAAAHACPSFRPFPLDRVRAAAEATWPHRRKIGLVGAAVLDWPPFREFAREVLARGGTVSPASVRADLVDEEIAAILGRSGHRTVALAPESGSEALRARVGKRVPDAVFSEAARMLARAGIRSFKLYFILGLPGASREEEVEGAVDFLASFRRALLAEGKRAGRLGTTTAVLSPFVPKPSTPLQWAPMIPTKELAARQEGVRRALRAAPNLAVVADPPRGAVTEGFLGLSDRRVASALAAARGGRLPAAQGEPAGEVAFVVFREKEAGEVFPWDIVAGALPKEILRARYEAIRRG